MKNLFPKAVFRSEITPTHTVKFGFSLSMEANQEDEDPPRRSNRDKLQSVVDTTKEKLMQIKGQVSNIT